MSLHFFVLSSELQFIPIQLQLIPVQLQFIPIQLQFIPTQEAAATSLKSVRYNNHCTELTANHYKSSDISHSEQ